MEWTDISITVAKRDADTAEAIATMVANGGIYIEDYSDLEQQAWEIAHVDLIEQDLLDKPRDIVIVHMYLAPDENPAEVLPLFEERLKNSGIGYQLNTTGVEQEDWQNAWKKYYHAMDIGERLAIVPGWEDYRTDRIRIVMDPGMAFGTGTHETTSLCLETLDSLVRLVARARYRHRLRHSGHCRVEIRRDSAEGVDIDPMCVRTAGENAARNGVADRFKVRRRPVLQGQRPVQHHHGQHRGGCHPVAGPACAGAHGPGRTVHRQRHHRRAQGRGAGRAEGRRSRACRGQGEARLGLASSAKRKRS